MEARTKRNNIALEKVLQVNIISGEETLNLENNEPTCFNDAKQNKKWLESTQVEYNSLMENNTWNLVTSPPDRKVVQSKWTFRLKKNSDGTISKYKARLVAKGFTQVDGVDYNETFAPVVKFTTIRTMLATAAIRNYRVCQLDISTAYLHADIEEEIYMEQPEGYEVTGENGEYLVCKLNKSIYGLKQAGRNWNKLMDGWLKNNNLQVSEADPCLYIYRSENVHDFLALAIYVDDLLTIDNNKSLRDKLVTSMEKDFKLVDLGEANWLLGMKITRDEDSIQIDQEKYSTTVLERFNMTESKSVHNTSCTSSNTNNEKDMEVLNQGEYMKLLEVSYI